MRELVVDGIPDVVAQKATKVLFDKIRTATKNTMHKKIRFHGVGSFEVGGRGNA